MADNFPAADPFGLTLVRGYRPDIIDRPRVIGPQPREPDHRLSSSAKSVKRNLKDLLAHWQTCDTVPEQCRERRGVYQVAEDPQEAEKLGEMLLIEATKHYQVIAFDFYFNRRAKERTRDNLVLVVGTLSGKAATFRLELYPERRLPKSLVELFKSQMCLISDKVVYKFQFLMGSSEPPRCWLDTEEIVRILPRHPRWRWATVGDPSIDDLCETVFGVLPCSLSQDRAKARPITASLGVWPMFKTPEILDAWGPGPVEAWRAAHFRNGVCKHLSLIILFSLLEFEFGKFSEHEDYIEPLLTVVATFCKKGETEVSSGISGTSSGASVIEEGSSKDLTEAKAPTSRVTNTVPRSGSPRRRSSSGERVRGANSRDSLTGRARSRSRDRRRHSRRDDRRKSGRSHRRRSRSASSRRRHRSGRPRSSRSARSRTRSRSRSGGSRSRRRDSSPTSKRRRPRSSSSPRARSSDSLETLLKGKLSELAAAVERLDSRKEFEATVNQSLQRTLELASPRKTGTDSTSLSSQTSSQRSQVPHSDKFTSVYERLEPRRIKDRLGPLLPEPACRSDRPHRPTRIQDLKTSAPRDLGKSRWFEPPVALPIVVKIPKHDRVSKLSLELLRAFPSDYFPLRWQSHPVFLWACRFCGETKKHKSYYNCVPCLYAWEKEGKEPDMNKWSKIHCEYPLCVSPRDHVIGACPTLHRLCLSCGKRGHSPSACCNSDLEKMFQTYGIRGAYTKESFDRGTQAKAPNPVWGWNPLQHAMDTPLQLLVGKTRAQWNSWGQGWEGIQESHGETLDALLRREHAKARGPSEAQAADQLGQKWGTGLPVSRVIPAVSSPINRDQDKTYLRRVPTDGSLISGSSKGLRTV